MHPPLATQGFPHFKAPPGLDGAHFTISGCPMRHGLHQHSSCPMSPAATPNTLSTLLSPQPTFKHQSWAHSLPWMRPWAQEEG